MHLTRKEIYSDARQISRRVDFREAASRFRRKGTVAVSFRQTLIAHGAIGSPEIDRLGKDLLLAATRANGLVIEANGGINFGVLVEPLGVNRVREGSAGAINEHLGPGGRLALAGDHERACDGK